MGSKLFLAAACIAGFALGFAQSAPRSHRFPSGIHHDKPTLTYDRLECPSEDEYRRLAAPLHLDVPASLDLCNDSLHAPLAKLLHFTANLKISIPPDFAPGLQPDLKDPLGFIGRMGKKLGFDLSQEQSIAYNRVADKEIYLGGLFFRELPLEGLSTLVHEARHSSEFDPGHVTCRRGDIPKTPGGCDEELSIDPQKAGAYSYGAAFYAAVGLYAEGLPEPDREYMLSAGLATVSTRFNVLPPELARAYDLVAILDPGGGLHLLHPFLREPVPLAPDFLENGEKIERIELNVRNDGLLLFTSQHRIFTWTLIQGFSPLYDGALPATLTVFDAARIRSPFGDYPYYTFLTGVSEIQYYHYESGKLAYELSPYPTYPAGAPVPELSRLFMGLAARSLFLGKDGQLYAGQRFGNEAPFDPRRDLQVPNRRWEQATGGIVYESLYGVTTDGRAQFTRTELLPTGDDRMDDESYSVSESSFQADGSQARKILEGLSFRALLDAQGGLRFEQYDQQRRSAWSHDVKAADFAILRTHVAGAAPAPEAGFKDRCRLVKAIGDPWLGIGLGLDESGQLVVGTPGGGCKVAASGPYRDLSLREKPLRAPRNATAERSTIFGEMEPVPRNTLRLVTEDGVTVTVLPYQYP